MQEIFKPSYKSKLIYKDPVDIILKVLQRNP